MYRWNHYNTSENARRHFDEWLARERATWSEYEADGDGSWASETAGALRSFSYEEWLSRARDVLPTRYDFTRPVDEYKDEIDRQMRDLSEGWLFYGNSVLPARRSMLDAFPDVREVSLDIGDLINGGYIGATEKLCETRRAPSASLLWFNSKCSIGLRWSLKDISNALSGRSTAQCSSSRSRHSYRFTLLKLPDLSCSSVASSGLTKI
jgi:HEPN/Toprim N-terminal domain 1